MCGPLNKYVWSMLYVMCGPLNICYMLCVIKYLLYVMCGPLNICYMLCVVH